MVNNSKEIDAFLSYLRTYAGEAYLGSDPPCIDAIAGARRNRRNEWGPVLAGYLLNLKRLPLQEVRQRMRKWNEKNSPPFELKEIEEIIGRAELDNILPSCNLLKTALCDEKKCTLQPPFYRCHTCGALISWREPRLRCPRCAGRVFFKPRPQRIRRWRLVGGDWRRAA